MCIQTAEKFTGNGLVLSSQQASPLFWLWLGVEALPFPGLVLLKAAPRMELGSPELDTGPRASCRRTLHKCSLTKWVECIKPGIYKVLQNITIPSFDPQKTPTKPNKQKNYDTDAINYHCAHFIVVAI